MHMAHQVVILAHLRNADGACTGTRAPGGVNGGCKNRPNCTTINGKGRQLFQGRGPLHNHWQRRVGLSPDQPKGGFIRA
jgi:hypothetical protein